MKLTVYSTLFIFLAGFSSLKAQDVQPPEKVVSSEIDVIRPYKPILAEAVKLRRSPDLDNLKTYKAKFSYSLTDRKLALNTDIQKLQAQQMADEKEAILVNNYVKGGLGNLGTILAEGYIGMGKDEALQTGVFFKHFGQSGKLNKQNENTQQLSVFGRSIGDKATLNGRLNYERHGLFFYGVDELNPVLNTDPEQQALSFIELEGEVVNRFTNDENALSYAAKANLYFFNDKFDAKEQVFTLSTYLNKRIRDFNVGLAANTEIGTTKDFSTKVSNNLLRLNPYLKLQANDVNIIAGINFVQEFGAFSSTRFFPAITADFTLIPDFLQLFGEIKGDVNRSSLKNFTDENPFLNSNINIQNSVEKLSISAGIKGTGGPGFGYKARFYSKKISDMPLFVNSFTTFNKFDVIYDFGNAKIFGLEGELSVQVSDNLKWTGKVNIDDYSPSSEQESYFKPQLRVNSNLLYAINQKLTFNANVAIQDDSKAKVFLVNPFNMASSTYPQVPDFTTENVVTIKGFVDLGMGADYKINSKFGAFVKINNLLNTNYSKYLYYRVNGLNAFGGISYSF
ncbi:hypothetical protein WG904_07360 [Pedobacter sp. Du54]|uniref:hypothetical protein n=1 Tax=Pedobacter anseongensis TaxID=3133439 RepID=UPI0030ADB832